AQQLQVRGLPTAAGPNWVFLYDASANLNGRERARLLVVPDTPNSPLLRHDDRLIDRYRQSQLWIGP
ncbi:MAG: hypothetical protein M3Z46_10220, partial [Actinomycetota bacterium]|nr:hypothetical protein [Actinomycetota bacterium]